MMRATSESDAVTPECPAPKRKTRRAHVKMEVEEERGADRVVKDEERKGKSENKSPATKKSPRGRKRAASPDAAVEMRTPTTKSSKIQSSRTPFAPPDDWREVLDIIKRMRQAGGAPVDTMGCEKISEDVASDAKGRRFVTLVSAMLSSQTKDPITHAATARLVEHGCTPENIAATPEDVLDALIVPVGFHQRKAGYLRAAAQICVDKYGGDIPPDVPGLMALPGVGPKMSYLVMNVGWGIPSGICVDVHVHRIAERLGWVPSVAMGRDPKAV